jgi:hypothetical protein
MLVPRAAEAGVNLNMSLKTIIIIICSFFILCCNNSQKPYGVFKYEDFGPQSMAYEKIGMQWWQWDNHGSSDPNYKYDIKVVVYQDMPLSQIKNLFPVEKSKKTDFRYFEYNDSIVYLNKKIKELEEEKEEWAVKLKKKLIQTKTRIQQGIGTTKN